MILLCPGFTFICNNPSQIVSTLPCAEFNVKPNVKLSSLRPKSQMPIGSGQLYEPRTKRGAVTPLGWTVVLHA